MNQPNVPRLKDVASEAGVSVSAASKILRGDVGRFGEETCRRVVETAEKLGWRRNLLVSGIQTGRTQTAGILIPPYDSFWVNVLSGIHKRLDEADYLPITVWQGDLDHLPHFDVNDSEGLRQINRLLDRRVDGLILWPDFALAYSQHLSELAERRVPVVVIDHRSPDLPWDTVCTNESLATSLVAKHLLDLGHRKIACISSRETQSQTWARERRQQFEKAVRMHRGAEVRSWQLNETGSNGRQVATELLTGDYQPTAVFAVTDHEARDVYEAAIPLGISIPGDLSVIGFADLDFASQLTPALTTVRQRPREIGTAAANLVLDRVSKNLDQPPQEIEIETDFILRSSTAPCPQA